AVALGDIDGDGRIDIACANHGANTLAVFLQSSSGGFSSSPTYTLSSSNGPFAPTDVEIADANGDGTLDVLGTSATNVVTAFLFDAELGAFQPTPLVFGNSAELSAPEQLTSADFDGDGHLDVAVANFGDSDIVIYLQRGGGSFSATPDAAVGDPVD